MRAISPSKVNIFLHVSAVGSDGYHPLRSWMCTTGFADVIRIEPTGPIDRLTCTDGPIPTDETNLALRACRALRSARPRRSFPPVHIHLEKHIPAGAGLGGGSSNAATVLSMLDQMWDVGLSPSERLAIASSLGSDVPFFLHAPSALCEGRGERVRPIPPPNMRGIVLILPGFHLSTAEVYRQFDRTHPIKELPEPQTASAELPNPESLGGMVNDLEPAAFTLCPEIDQLRSAAERIAARPVRMSGSGSTLFTVAETLSDALQLAQLLGHELGTRCEGVELCPDPSPTGQMES